MAGRRHWQEARGQEFVLDSSCLQEQKRLAVLTLEECDADSCECWWSWIAWAAIGDELVGW